MTWEESIEKARTTPAPNPWGLSAAEYNVVLTFARKGTMKETANELNISVKTVECHMMTARKKMGVRNKVQAAILMDRMILRIPIRGAMEAVDVQEHGEQSPIPKA